MTKSKRSDEIRRFKVWKTCVATVQNPQLSVLYNSTTANVKANVSSPSQKRPREPSLDYLPKFVNKEPALESSDDNSSTPSNEILQMYDKRIAYVKANANKSSPTG